MEDQNEWVVRLKNVNDDKTLSESEPLHAVGVSSKIRALLSEHDEADPNNLMVEVIPNE